MKYFVSAFCFLLIVQVSFAQKKAVKMRSSTEGFNIGLTGNTLGWSSDYFSVLDENAGSGYGIGLRAGYGITQLYEVFVQYDKSFMDVQKIDAQSFNYQHIDAGLRFNFGSTTRPFRPFVEAGYSARQMSLNKVFLAVNNYGNLDVKGGGLYLGGGFNYFVALPVALTLKGSLNPGGKGDVYVNNTSIGDKADLSTFRISAGIVLYISQF
ncbi:MAG: outer membrane beta-barrel protein [Spirosomataceae bacterium]